MFTGSQSAQAGLATSMVSSHDCDDGHRTMSERSGNRGQQVGAAGQGRSAVEPRRRVVPAGGPPRLRRDNERKRVLIVDDDFDARTALEEFFSAYGYETAIAKDGEEALALLTGELPIDFVVLDLMMPRMSGFDFLKAKKGLPPRQREVPVAVASAVAAPFLGDVVATFQKPTPILELLRVVESYLCTPGSATGSSSA